MSVNREKTNSFSPNFHELVYKQILAGDGQIKGQYQKYLVDLMIDLDDIKARWVMWFVILVERLMTSKMAVQFVTTSLKSVTITTWINAKPSSKWWASKSSKTELWPNWTCNAKWIQAKTLFQWGLPLANKLKTTITNLIPLTKGVSPTQHLAIRRGCFPK